MDINDYILDKAIGADFEEVPCTVWENMQNAANNTFDAYQRRMTQYFSSGCGINGLDYSNLQQKQKVDTFLNIFNSRCVNYIKARNKFFNGLICPENQLTGIVPTTIKSAVTYNGTDTGVFQFNGIGTLRVQQTDITIDIDYTGTNAFSSALYNEYKKAIKDINLQLKQSLTFFNGATALQLKTVPDSLTGTCVI